MGIAILVRHGDLVRGSESDDIKDELTPKALEFAKRLPRLLSGKYTINKVYYDNSKKIVPNPGYEQVIERCKRTIEHFEGIPLIPYTNETINLVFNKENEKKTIVVCYQSERLDLFPNIKQIGLIQYMIDHHPPNKVNIKKTDFMYEQILVVEYKGGNLVLIEWIPTETYKGEK